MAEEEKENKIIHYVIKDIALISNDERFYGYWQAYLFDEFIDSYDKVYNPFIFYKGKFFDNLESKPWTKENINAVRLLANYFNKSGDPICVFRFEKPL